MRINSIKIKINNNAIILFVLLLPLFRPSCVTLYKNILQFYNIITFLAFCYLIIEYIIKKDNNNIAKYKMVFPPILTLASWNSPLYSKVANLIITDLTKTAIIGNII